MALRDVRNQLLQSYDDDLIDDEDFVLLYDLNRSKYPYFPYWEYDRFDLDQLSDVECKAEFRFSKSDINALIDILHIPDEISCYNRTLASGTEAFCILLRRFSYPNRYSDMISRFGHRNAVLSYPNWLILYTTCIVFVCRPSSKIGCLW